MARSTFSPSPSPGLDSSQFSDSSLDDEQLGRPDIAQPVPSVSRPGSPAQNEASTSGVAQGDTVECQWEDCAKVFDRLSTLIDHLHHGELLEHTYFVSRRIHRLVTTMPY